MLVLLLGQIYRYTKSHDDRFSHSSNITNTGKVLVLLVTVVCDAPH
jgi:hypothetical protein